MCIYTLYEKVRKSFIVCEKQNFKLNQTSEFIIGLGKNIIFQLHFVCWIFAVSLEKRIKEQRRCFAVCRTIHMKVDLVDFRRSVEFRYE